MFAEFLNRDVVLHHLDLLKKSVVTERGTKSSAGQPTADEDALLTELNQAEAKERVATTGQASFEPPTDRRVWKEAPPLDDYVFISKDPVISLLQSALDECAECEAYNDGSRAAAPPVGRLGDELPLVTDESLGRSLQSTRARDRRLFEKFSITDIGWVRSKVAEGIRLLRGKHEFNSRPAKVATMPDRVRLVLVGDWGTGLPRAQAVAAQMRIKIDEALAQGVSVHVIHLGDVYYSGWGREYKKRFLPYWPVRAGEAQRVGSWCLNANHDMYSGGYGYFGDALGDPRFAAWQNDGHKPTSFFSLVNAHWKILGLDTGWDNAGLKDPQNQWLEDELRSAGGRKTLLLSHHQLFSAFDEVASTLVKKVTPILSRNPVTAWFWGHEHRCMSFAAHANVKFGRCVGDGGVPVYQWHKESDPYPPPGLYEHRRFILNGLERWAYMGFAVLDLTNDKIEAKYVDDKGIEHRRETIS